MRQPGSQRNAARACQNLTCAPTYSLGGKSILFRLDHYIRGNVLRRPGCSGIRHGVVYARSNFRATNAPTALMVRVAKQAAVSKAAWLANAAGLSFNAAP